MSNCHCRGTCPSCRGEEYRQTVSECSRLSEAIAKIDAEQRAIVTQLGNAKQIKALRGQLWAVGGPYTPAAESEQAERILTKRLGEIVERRQALLRQLCEGGCDSQ